ncbi:hypothetical protein VEZ01S_08_00680 [Vibrio ezurae NBRC 102218]|uniref:Uncharacterized protein n=1 Tax=Vibrio ezurae NBRC 102218 TaxID=1219080 RepID=U3B0M7_9VIBR|nr:hypothetical protein VEZ01S_08_00680 [Vibrio ezurae NBRC 102218]
MYLIKSNYGIYYFRFTVRANGIQHQPKLSLRTKCKRKARYHSAILSNAIYNLPRNTVDAIKATYSEQGRGYSSFIKSTYLVIGLTLNTSPH